MKSRAYDHSSLRRRTWRVYSSRILTRAFRSRGVSVPTLRVGLAPRTEDSVKRPVRSRLGVREAAR